MDFSESGSPWIWHPDWVDNGPDTAGRFVHFRKHIKVHQVSTVPIRVNITADTRYKMYINNRLVHHGPVKGDENRWFYDTLDIQPFLIPGDNNHVNIHVLRYFHATKLATSFARMPIGGLYIRTVDKAAGVSIDSDATWETAIDPAVRLRTDEKLDLFLHIFERVDRRRDADIKWTNARVVDMEEAWGITFQAEDYITGHLAFRFAAGTGAGSTIRVTYEECYEDQPYVMPFARRKGHRCDSSKSIFGPSDMYTTGGLDATTFGYYAKEPDEEVFQPFHYRSFRYIALDIQVSTQSALSFAGIEISRTNYPLTCTANVSSGDEWVSQLLDISVRTLKNCMHNCYEDCPFYEQLQYPMDTQSSSLFTYLVSGDDRLARQAMVQMQVSFVPSLGLITSRTGSASLQRQFIPPFTLYWINMVVDHYEYYADKEFSDKFTAIAHAVLETFKARIDPEYGLVRAPGDDGLWDYTDWTRFWVPYGVPPAYKRTGFATYTNCLYSYTLRRTC